MFKLSRVIVSWPDIASVRLIIATNVVQVLTITVLLHHMLVVQLHPVNLYQFVLQTISPVSTQIQGPALTLLLQLLS